MEEKLTQNFVCSKCRCREAVTKTVSLGSGLPNILNLNADRFLLISCGACGYTEVYNAHAFALNAEPASAKIPEVPQAP